MKSINASLVTELLSHLDGTGSDKERASIQKLKAQLGGALPEALKTHYSLSRGWKVRAACVFYCLAYARSSDAAIELGKVAVLDKSKVVRYRACMLLACSLKRDLLPFLKDMKSLTENETKADLAAAIDAIENQNQHLFLDREHRGLITLNVDLEEAAEAGNSPA